MKYNRLAISLIALVAVLSANAQLLWKISDPKSGNTSYIVGSHHLAPPTIVDSMPTLKTVMAETERTVGEIDMVSTPKQQIAMKVSQFMLAPADSTLSKLYDAQTFAELDKKFKQIIGSDLMSLAMFEQVRPMAVNSVISLTVMQNRLPDYNPQFQLDTYLQEQAKGAGKPIIGLETPEQQAEILYCSTPISVQAQDLKEVLDNPEELISEAEKLNALYFAGDLEGLLALSRSEEGSPEFLDALLNNRNKEWLTKLPAILAEKPTLVVVGALHLPGEHGVLQGLRNAGFTVEPMK